VTPEQLQATYDWMRRFKPFCRWKLPDGEVIAFEVNRDLITPGYYNRVPRTQEHCIGASVKHIGTILTLQKVMGHEMIHLKQALAKTETSGQHNAEFRALAKQVCKVWSWDVQDFYF
jgi:hypothetical protein